MRVLIGCECSGRVREAFRAEGCDAWSCDLKADETGSPFHIQGDVLEHLDDGWDLAVFHPECKYLCSSGLHWNKRREGRKAKTEAALEFVGKLMDAPIPHWALENSIGCISTRIRPYDQKIQPWKFGEDASKGTCLWLKGLSKLRCTEVVPPRGWENVVYAMDLPLCPDCQEEVWCELHGKHYSECACIGPTEDEVTYKTIEGCQFGTRAEPAPHPVWGNQTPSGQNKLGPSPTRSADRARTYPGIAKAMAEQWTKFVKEAEQAG